MISTAPNHVFAPGSAANAVVGRHRPVRWLFAWLQRFLCGLHGHDAILQDERTRIFLRCTSCGYETPGWEVAADANALRRRPIDTRPALARRGELAVVRKIA